MCATHMKPHEAVPLSASNATTEGGRNVRTS